MVMARTVPGQDWCLVNRQRKLRRSVAVSPSQRVLHLSFATVTTSNRVAGCLYSSHHVHNCSTTICSLQMVISSNSHLLYVSVMVSQYDVNFGNHSAHPQFR
jgi:hypothetical protein